MANERAYLASPKICKQCQAPLNYARRHNTFCSSRCSQRWQNSDPLVRTRFGEEVRRRMASGTWKRGNPPNRSKAKIKIKCQQCGESMQVSPCYAKKKYCSHKCASRGYTSRGRSGGLRVGSGRGKTGWYKGYYCSSSWELAWVIYQLEHNISFSRNTVGFSYLFEGRSHLYYPDFVLPDGSYIEIKGYSSTQWKVKIDQFQHPIKVLSKAEIKPIIDYVVSKHGTNYLDLYEGNPHNVKLNRCVICNEPCKKVACSRRCSGKLLAKGVASTNQSALMA